MVGGWLPIPKEDIMAKKKQEEEVAKEEKEASSDKAQYCRVVKQIDGGGVRAVGPVVEYVPELKTRLQDDMRMCTIEGELIK